MTHFVRLECSKGPFEWHKNNFVKIPISRGTCVDRIESQKHESALLLIFLIGIHNFAFSRDWKKKRKKNREIKDPRK